MSDSMSEFEKEINKKGLPTSINVLTILTFIGSGIGILSSIWTYVRSAKSLADMEEMASKPEFAKMPEFAKKMYSPEAIEMMRKVDANKLPVMIVSLVSCLLCIYGAIEMRKLKISGFYSYCVGSVFPYLGMIVLIGTSFFSGFGVYFGVGITVLFIVLYSFQTKYLTNK